MPHVELSLTEDASRLAPGSPAGSRVRETVSTVTGCSPRQLPPSLARWAATAAAATEPSLVLDADSVIVAASAAGAELLGLGDPATAAGSPLLDAVGHLVDFTDVPGQLDSAEADKIPPLLAISSGRLARGLIRVVCSETGTARTLDAIATPLLDGGSPTGSLTFFSKV